MRFPATQRISLPKATLTSEASVNQVLCENSRRQRAFSLRIPTAAFVSSIAVRSETAVPRSAFFARPIRDRDTSSYFLTKNTLQLCTYADYVRPTNDIFCSENSAPLLISLKCSFHYFASAAPRFYPGAACPGSNAERGNRPSLPR